jgi:hypothetical protein
MGKEEGQHKVISEPIVGLSGCSPDGEWVLTNIASPKEESSVVQVAYGLRQQGHVSLCANCLPQWSRDGRILYVLFRRRVYAIQLSGGAMFPKLPPGGITADNVTTLPVVRTYDYDDAQASGLYHHSDNLATYAFYRATSSRNIYRIPLP